jgi:hypothetical protein
MEDDEFAGDNLNVTYNFKEQRERQFLGEDRS